MKDNLKMKSFLVLTIYLVFVYIPEGLAIESINNAHVYRECEKIAAEIGIIKNSMNIRQEAKVEKIGTALKNHHIWQKTYEILIKINILREKNRFPIIAVSSCKPVKKLNTFFIYEQTRRIILEIQLVKENLGIEQKVDSSLLDETFYVKSNADVYNLLDAISAELDIINGEKFTPRHVFSQAMRILDDINFILDALNIIDTTVPPKKNKDVEPKDVFGTAFELLNVIQSLQAMVAIETTDFYDFKRQNITPKEVFEINLIVLAELQIIKAHLGLRSSMTPPAGYYENKIPADVQQILGWAIRRLKLIKSL